MVINKKLKISLVVSGILILILIFFIPQFCVAQPSVGEITQTIKQNSTFQNDTISKDQYIEFLEKVNQQISYTWNPQNFMISLLTILFTIGAIIAAVIIYLQSRDYRRRSERNIRLFNAKAEKILKEEINAIVGARKKWVKSVTEWIREKDRFLSRSKKQLKEIKEEASEGKDVTDKIKEIEGRIEKIENEKDKLSASRFPLDSHSYSRSYPSQDAVFTGQGLLRRCAICGRERVPIDSMSALCDECNMDKRATSGSQYDL